MYETATIREIEKKSNNYMWYHIIPSKYTNERTKETTIDLSGLSTAPKHSTTDQLFLN